MTSWVEHVIWWHVYPLGFVGAGHHRTEPHALRRLEGWLDHLVSLGANGLLLGPVFTSSSHGYDTTDYFHVDPRLGDDADLDRLVIACHDRGIRVLLDGVFNHAGREFPPVAQALAEGAGSPAAEWVSRLYDHGGTVTADYFEGHDTLVTLNHASPRVQEFVRHVMLHWLRRGIDGWRLDAAYAVPASFWAAVMPGVRQEFGEVWFVGEMIHGDYAGYVAESGIDSVTQYELWKAVWSALDSVNLHELDWTLRRHRDLLEHVLPMTFLSNHDVTRVASQVRDHRHLTHAVALLGFLPGVPSVYYGDEFGLEAVKEQRPGGDDAVRPEFPQARGRFSNPHPEVEAAYRRMLGLRRRHPWLVDAVVTTDQVANDHLLVHAAARREPGQRLSLVLNLADRPYAALERGAALEASSPLVEAAVAPHGWAVLVPGDR
ncbi:MAG TPA: alpha-amylase family glycosyl hydrolase [Propionibacteriaceae bacterium]|nr:alpha-amylase family glycosyl hydrolase [Propionibacteriaceae bacterium]